MKTEIDWGFVSAVAGATVVLSVSALSVVQCTEKQSTQYTERVKSACANPDTQACALAVYISTRQ